MTAAGADEDLLRSALTEALIAADVGAPAEIVRLPSERRSTFPLERLQVKLADGERLQVAFKRLEWQGLTSEAKIAKPSFMFAPAREPTVYATLLPLAPAGPARYLGSVPGEGGDGRWLFLEWVQGRPLQEVGERALWVQAARWLAGMHVALAPGLPRHVATAGLRELDAAQCSLWLQRARRFAQADGQSTPETRFLDRLQRRYDVVIEALLQLPKTLVHGDFHAANVLVGDGAGDAPAERNADDGPPADDLPDAAPVEDGSSAVRIAPVDWEMAAAGPGLLDLAALVSGDWEDAERRGMVAAYASVQGVPPFTERQLDLARLHHAVQWLGWAPRSWRPPIEQRHDWLADAIELAEKLEI